MKASPVQLLQLFFKQVNIEQDVSHTSQEIPNPITDIFTFDNVTIATRVGKAEIDPPHERGAMFLISLGVTINNEHDEKLSGQKFSPYKIDVVAEAMILIPNGVEKLGSPEDLAVVNGASLIWSAIREQVLSITSRMPSGPVMLPTVHFHDLKQSASPAAAPEKKTRKHPKD